MKIIYFAFDFRENRMIAQQWLEFIDVAHGLMQSIRWMKLAHKQIEAKNEKKCSENWDACSAMTISCAGCSVFVTWSTRWMGFLLTFFVVVAAAGTYSIKTIPITLMSMKSNGSNREKNYQSDWMIFRSTTGHLLIQ